MKTIETFKNKLENNRLQFGAALKAAGYVDKLIIDNINNDSELLRLATEIYTDLWGAFDIPAFEEMLSI